MILRIKTSDFSLFSGYDYLGEDTNNTLDEYIKLFKSNPLLTLFYIEQDRTHGFPFDTVCYIADKIGYKDELGRKIKMFTRTEKDDDGKPIKHFLCFSKIEKEKE